MKSILKLPLLLFISFIALSCNSQQKSKEANKSGGITAISPKEFSEKSANQLIIDVRTPEEFSEGYIENAININFYDDNFINQFANYNKEEPIFVYCRSGGRSGKASKKLLELGFKNVYDLKGGYLNWTKDMSKVKE